MNFDFGTILTLFIHDVSGIYYLQAKSFLSKINYCYLHCSHISVTWGLWFTLWYHAEMLVATKICSLSPTFGIIMTTRWFAVARDQGHQESSAWGWGWSKQSNVQPIVSLVSRNAVWKTIYIDFLIAIFYWNLIIVMYIIVDALRKKLIWVYENMDLVREL